MLPIEIAPLIDVPVDWSEGKREIQNAMYSGSEVQCVLFRRESTSPSERFSVTRATRLDLTGNRGRLQSNSGNASSSPDCLLFSQRAAIKIHRSDSIGDQCHWKFDHETKEAQVEEGGRLRPTVRKRQRAAYQPFQRWWYRRAPERHAR